MSKNKNPFFVAEISSNHKGNLGYAKRLIEIAKLGGANAVKLQTYTPSSMTVNSKKKYFLIKNGIWKGYNLWDLYSKAQTPYRWHKILFDYAKKIGIKIFSTPFDEGAVDFLENLNCPFYKVASFEMNDLSLIKKIISTNKPIIISTGMSSLDEIDYIYNKTRDLGAKKITLLYCVSNYPSKISDFNLNNILIMKKKFKCDIGFSDHSESFDIPSVAAKIGAQLIEKHICLKNVKGLDYNFSINENQIKNYRSAINNKSLVSRNSTFFKKLMGKKYFFRNKTENASKQFRRSIFIVKDIKKGDFFSNRNIKRIRPGHGVSPIYFDKILGKKSNFSSKAFEPLKEKMVKYLKLKI
jgi:pseudaminic acid synthase